MIGIATITAHAPSANFVLITIAVTTSVVVAPTAFSAAFQGQPGRRVRSQ